MSDNRNNRFPAVRAMLTPGAQTCPLNAFLEAYKESDNWWWTISSGHHQNLFDEAVERMGKAERELAIAREALSALLCASHHSSECEWLGDEQPWDNARRALESGAKHDR